MRLIRALSIGSKARSVLLSRINEEIMIHSVFPRSVNLEVGGEIIAITATRIGSEYSIKVDHQDHIALGGDFTALIRGGCVSIDYSAIYIEDLMIDLGGAKIYRSRVYKHIPCSPPAGEQALRAIMNRYIGIAEILGKQYSEENTLISWIMDDIERLERIARTEPEDIEARARNIIAKYIGLGRGLTPSGDDLVAGFISVYNSILPHCIGLGRIMLDEEILRNTNRLSAYMLNRASEGVINEAIDNMLVSKRVEDLEDALIDLLSQGHSSGYMMGVGGLAALILYAKLLQKA